MKHLLTATAAAALLAAPALAQDDTVKIGILLGFTGPIESMTQGMATGAEFAIQEINDSGNFPLGTVEPVRADSTCIDAAAATAAAERLITSDGVAAIIGAACSGVTGAVLQNVARPNGIVMISPSATSPALSDAEDDGLFFRTAPSDARQGEVIAEVLAERGVNEIALTYTNNDYGKGLADSIQSAFEAQGGTVTISAAHEDGKADYSAEIGALASAGGDILVVAGYADQGGQGIVRAALDAGAFDTFQLPDGMVSDSLTDTFGSEIDGSYGQIGGSDSEGGVTFAEMADEAGFDATGAYTAESYDAAALMLLAMAAAGSTESAEFKDKITEVANAPGEPIQPGELGRALEILAEGGDIDYVGATAIELVGNGESAGNFREVEVRNGEFETIGYR
ncbi:branched-chain amino acid ABC transporter substrate-binding protein [Palleronia sediminis]|uniref:Branched-chain amino acid ABC transporter substrate-binding protein n=1 Tax=Palleronia sediminis TaxID=2547833 RepID=A0A4R6AIP0_9RHOB|nr:ABC transporter substrate-binding protein [Palleronia sediminis]TDL81243.1 branched-chain amino acid ABC transporter substrate-binding protein [Palleronia sediminis]